MKTNWLKLVAFANTANAYLERNLKESKFTYALNRVIRQVPAAQAKIDQAIEDIEIDHCIVGDVGGQSNIILRDEGGRLQFDRETLKKVNRLKREVYAKEDIEIEPYFASEAPSNLSLPLRDVFMGFVIRPEEEPITEPAHVETAEEAPAS